MEKPRGTNFFPLKWWHDPGWRHRSTRGFSTHQSEESFLKNWSIGKLWAPITVTSAIIMVNGVFNVLFSLPPKYIFSCIFVCCNADDGGDVFACLHFNYKNVGVLPKTGIPGHFGAKNKYILKPSTKHTPEALRLASLTWYLFQAWKGRAHLVVYFVYRY